jgi:hypothetical protein
MQRRLASLFLALGVCACGGSDKPKTQPPSPATAAPGAAAPGTAAPGPSAAPATAATAAPAPAPDAPPFNGEDPRATVTITGPKAWVLSPEQGGIVLADFVRMEGTRVVFKNFIGDAELTVPSAFAFQPPAAPKLQKGDVVLTMVAGPAVCGRVRSVKGEEVEVAFEWSGEVDTRTEPPNEVLRLEGALQFGAPVLYEEEPGGGWLEGQLVYQGGKIAWLSADVKVSIQQVRPIDVTRKYEPGDAVLARSPGMFSFVPGKVKKVLDDGVRYEVAHEDGDTFIAPICMITTPPK